MDRQRRHVNSEISNTFDMTTAVSASPPVGLELPEHSTSEGNPSHYATRRYSTLKSHPFATSSRAEDYSDSGSPSTEDFGQINFGRPDANSISKGKAKVVNYGLPTGKDLRTAVAEGLEQTNGMDRNSYPYSIRRRHESPQGASRSRPPEASGASSPGLFYQPQTQQSATSEAFQDAQGLYGRATSTERNPRSDDILAPQQISSLSGLNIAAYPPYESAIPISATARAQGLTIDTPTSAFPTGPPHRPDHIRSKTASSSTSTASAYRRRDRVPSRDILQAALDLAQKAVEYDGANDIPAALSMYREAVSKLRSVMGRVGLQLEPISPDLGIPELSERENGDISAAARRRKASTLNRSEEEGKTLKGIHDAYVARIGLLRVMAGEEVVIRRSPITHSPLSQQSASHVVSSPSIGHSGLSGIGNLMMNGLRGSPIAEGGGDHAFQNNENSTADPTTVAEGSMVLNPMGDVIPHMQPPTISPRKASLNKHSVYAGAHAVSPSPSFASFSQGRASRRPSAASTHQKNVTDTSYEVISTAGLSLRIPDPPISTAVAVEPPATSTTALRRSNLVTLSGSSDERQSSSRSQAQTEYHASPGETNHDMQTLTMAQGPANVLTSSQTPLSPVRAPFHVLLQIRQSMRASQGDFISPALFVPRGAWNQVGVKIPSMETKIRVMELLSQNLSSVQAAGSLLESNQSSGAKTLETALEDFEALSEEVRRLLTKKLGDKVNFAKPRKSNSSTISSWGSKFSKTFDKMGSTRSADSLSSYVDCLSRLCLNAQVFDRHLESLHSILSSDLQSWQSSRNEHAPLEKRLNRISDFFGGVILAFVLQDLSLLLSKYLKQSSKWMEE